MDQRLIVTVPYVAHLVGGAMLAVAYSVASVQFTDGQLEFIVLVGYLGPTVAMGLVWLRNYVYGAPLLFASAIAGWWFVLYFFLINDNPANVAAVGGDGASAYLYATIAVLVTSLLTAGVGAWLWYRESDGFRSAVDRVIRPPDSSE
ncbi:hypothetical protein [Natronobiforma cellulositropha]|uniref:hypothetical protein n=1 Tax=Natronobiforma cellulositropha TaxID=1679076 RepID=UPI0021D6116E|nr:hypothetical protein [Natronobiforma cellulositropha]